MADRERELKPGQKVHPRISRGQGAPLVLERQLDIDCTVCNRGKMWVVDETEGADIAIHCERCDNSATMKRSSVPRPLVPAGETAAPGYGRPAARPAVTMGAPPVDDDYGPEA